MEEIKTPYSFGDCRNLEFQNVVDLILKEKCFQKSKLNLNKKTRRKRKKKKKKSLKTLRKLPRE